MNNIQCASGKDSVTFSRAVIRFLIYILGIVLFQTAVRRSSKTSQSVPGPAPNPLRNAYFGDLHVHTSYSLDAYIGGNRRGDPARAAYRFLAEGEPIILTAGGAQESASVMHFWTSWR